MYQWQSFFSFLKNLEHQVAPRGKFSSRWFLSLVAKARNAISLAALLLVAGCSSNPHKAKPIETQMEKDEAITQDTRVGVKDGNMVVQRKVLMSEELRRLQNEVFTLEDRVYGSRQYGSKGLYGVLKDCRMKLADKKNGGDGKLMWTEPIERVTERDREEVSKLGLDEKEKIVGLSEEFLKDRIDRYRGYRNILEKRQDEYEDKISVCQTELLSRQRDQEASARTQK